MFDCGEGTQIQIAKSDDVKLGKLSAVFITHLHGDHSFGLPGLLASMSLLAGSETRQVLCIGPKGIGALGAGLHVIRRLQEKGDCMC
jgi:ribonuclease Z